MDVSLLWYLRGVYFHRKWSVSLRRRFSFVVSYGVLFTNRTSYNCDESSCVLIILMLKFSFLLVRVEKTT